MLIENGTVRDQGIVCMVCWTCTWSSSSAVFDAALSHLLSHLQGPPGTGKTTTIVRFLALLKRELGLKIPVLACAQSNVGGEGYTYSGCQGLSTPAHSAPGWFHTLY
jgi:hypothetical protein